MSDLGKSKGDKEKDKEKEKKIRVLLSTCPQGVAESLARFLVENRHAACVNVVPQVTSIYRWEGQVKQEPESLLVIKSGKKGLKKVIAALVEEHPYDVPEVVVLTVKGGNPDYLDWVNDSVGS